MFTKEEYKKEERKQTIHRSVNSLLSVFILMFGMFFIKNQLTPIYEELSGITEQRAIEENIYSEIVQIGQDEGYRRCVYNDTEGNPTAGYGHLLLPDEDYTCIDAHLAVSLLRKDYTIAQKEVEKRYPWANTEVKMVLINMTFNMGSTRLAGFTETLKHLEAEEYDKAAGEILDSKYGRKLPRRASLMAVRIMRLQR